MNKKLLEKYDVPAPRYTSYPTVPYWTDSPTSEQWVQSLNQAFAKDSSTWSMYLHIPFCESLCTFCGCNTIITKSHKRENGYVELIKEEWSNYLERVPELSKRPIRQIHLGGGTPTFLSADNLRALLKPIMDNVIKDPKYFEGSIEVDPRRTQIDQLEALQEFGFNRISLGVQDFNEEVQQMVNRVQPFDITESLTKVSREMGYESVNFDLIYGLPRQTLDRMKMTVEKTLALEPDRIALYSLAIVPWIKPAQRIFKDEDLPEPAEKRELYEYSRQQPLDHGYIEIGMDHFAKPTDSLAQSLTSGQLHRNFMGYTDIRTDVLLGLGVSAISETPTCFHQNEKVLPVYERKVKEGEVPTLRGHLLSDEDQVQRERILHFMTQFEVDLVGEQEQSDLREFLGSLIDDGLVQLEPGKLKVTEAGRPFLRNACMALDKRLRRSKPDARVFSQSV